MKGRPTNRLAMFLRMGCVLIFFSSIAVYPEVAAAQDENPTADNPAGEQEKENETKSDTAGDQTTPTGEKEGTTTAPGEPSQTPGGETSQTPGGETSQAPEGEPPQPPEEEATEEEEEVESDFFSTRIYGVIDAYWEQVFEEIAGVDNNGNTLRETPPSEFDLPNLTLNAQGTLADRYSFFLTLAFPGASGIDPRSAWVNVALYGDYIGLRAGKMYRKFGIYNEMLDAVPTYMGIEPPELFDGDHLLLTRTTNLMLHGSAQFGPNGVSYAITSGNDERHDDEFPLGLDLNYMYKNLLLVGTSFYSTMGKAAPSKGVGDGSPSGGVATWMSQDKYVIFGGYAQLFLGAFKLQTEFWHASHDAKRDPSQVIKLLDAGLNKRQLARFGLDGTNPAENDVKVDVDYSIQTFYIRTGYTFDLPFGAITPYLQYDYYDNPETIASKSHGGDNEAGLSDNGKFHKTTWGVVFRPIPPVALKVDGSAHIQKFNGETVVYPEMRISLSYMWHLPTMGGEL